MNSLHIQVHETEADDLNDSHQQNKLLTPKILNDSNTNQSILPVPSK